MNWYIFQKFILKIKLKLDHNDDDITYCVINIIMVTRVIHLIYIYVNI